MFLVEAFDRVEGVALNLLVHASGVGEIQDRIADAAEQNALINRREKTGAPIGGPAAGTFGAGAEHDAGGQVLRLAAEAVGGPGADAGPAELLRAGAHQNLSRRVVEGVRVHG